MSAVNSDLIITMVIHSCQLRLRLCCHQCPLLPFCDTRAKGVECRRDQIFAESMRAFKVTSFTPSNLKVTSHRSSAPNVGHKRGTVLYNGTWFLLERALMASHQTSNN